MVTMNDRWTTNLYLLIIICMLFVGLLLLNGIDNKINLQNHMMYMPIDGAVG